MGAWGPGPFENDAAADFSAGLDRLPQGERPSAIREALLAAVRETGYLEGDEGNVAVAAAAIIAAQCPGGSQTGTANGPGQPVPLLAAELKSLAVQALDRVSGAGSEAAELWAEGGDENPRAAELSKLRQILLSM